MVLQLNKGVGKAAGEKEADTPRQCSYGHTWPGIAVERADEQASHVVASSRLVLVPVPSYSASHPIQLVCLDIVVA